MLKNSESQIFTLDNYIIDVEYNCVTAENNEEDDESNLFNKSDTKHILKDADEENTCRCRNKEKKLLFVFLFLLVVVLGLFVVQVYLYFTNTNTKKERVDFLNYFDLL